MYLLYVKIIVVLTFFYFFGSFCYDSGANKVQKEFDLYKIEELKTIEEHLLKQQNQKLLIDGLIRKIEEQNEQNKKKIDEIRIAADNDLADRLRREKSRASKCPVSTSTKATDSSIDTGATEGTIVFPESVAKGLEERHEYADRLTESLRVCRHFISLHYENY